MHLKILDPGMLTTIQDNGRIGMQQYGVIVGGAMDQFAYTAANLLVGNTGTQPVIEMTMFGGAMSFDTPVLLAICGADMSPEVNGIPVPMWRPVWLAAGAVLRMGRAIQGCRSYVAISGGLELPLVMNSYATYLRAGIGGVEGRALRQGDRITLRAPSPLGAVMMEQLSAGAARAGNSEFYAAKWLVSPEMMPNYRRNPVLRVIEGPEYMHFTEKSRAQLYTEPYRITPHSDRMGYTLTGEALRLASPLDMLSDAVTFGTIQVPPSGLPVILMPDRQTTGGYPRIAQVITADLPVLAQTPIGDTLTLEKVSVEEAQQLLLRERRELDGLSLSIRLKHTY